MADALNDAGLTIRKAIETGKLKLDIPWTEHSIQQIFTDAYLDHVFDKPDYPVNSISDLTSVEISELHKLVDHGIAEIFGVSLPFPSEEALMESQQ